MIKTNFTPSITAMATLTVSFRVIFFIKIGFMDVFVAVDTLQSDVPETPFILFFMTGKTGRRKVRSGQFKLAMIMHFKGVTGPVKSQGRMAIRTIG